MSSKLLVSNLTSLYFIMAQTIPNHMLQHLEYLRNLHLEGPKIGNIYLQDTALITYLHNHPIYKNQKFQQELQRLGDRFATVYLSAARNAQQNHPRLQQFDSYGRRIDKLHLSQGWKQLGKYSAEDGIVAMAYQSDRFGLKENQRLGQLVALYMYHCSSGLYGCPLAMSDGAAYTLRHMDRSNKPHLEQAFQHLISRTDPWTSGQWMTQKKGGSDVSNTETLAIKNQKGTYNLYGYKWFTSATESQMSLGLAKIIPKDAIPSADQLQNTKVSLFFIRVQDKEGGLNRMEIIRLKDKLGTQQLPTAQLLLKGTQAHLISEQGNGVKMISKMLTVTRVYNSATAVGVMRRMVALARDYSNRRTIGKMKLNQMPLQVRVLSHLELTHRANLIFYLNVCQLFSKEHAGTINEDEANMLRVFTPILKLFTAKQAMEVVTEGLQSFGGMGFIQGTMLPTLMRDAQVLSIWEGTTNVLCYDFVRALLKKENSVSPLISIIKFFTSSFEKIGSAELTDKTFIQSNKEIITNYLDIIAQLQEASKTAFKHKLGELRTYCFGLARIYIATLLQLQALSSMRQIDIQISNRWTKRGLFTVEGFDYRADRKIGLDLSDLNSPQGVGEVDSRGRMRARF